MTRSTGATWNRQVDRRQFLAGAAGVAGLAVGGLALAGCSTSTSNTTTNTKAAPAPAFVPYSKVTPDIPAGAHGVPAAFFRYPESPERFLKGPIGNGGSISFLTQGVVSTPSSSNPWLRALARNMNADIKISEIAFPDYLNKLQVAVAGGDLQDVLLMQVTPAIANMPRLLQSDFADLSDHLSGDNVKNYPGLAALASSAWEISTLNGRIWGIPQPRPIAGNIVSTRGDTLQKWGIDPSSLTVSSGADFLDLCKHLSDPNRGKYAFGEQPNVWLLSVLLEMFGAPNRWKVEGGKFTSVNETDEMKSALEQASAMWKAKYIHPDSFTTPESNIIWWSGGITTLYVQSFAGWSAYAQQNPTWNLGALPLPKWNGGGPANKLLGLPGYSAFAAVKKAKPSRVKEILRVLDYIAAPFGTQEYLDVNFGVKGVDYDLHGSDPVPTAKAATDGQLGLNYFGSQVFQNIYVPGQPNVATAQHQYLTKVLPTGVADPTIGLYSPTASTKGTIADTNLLNAQGDIIQGRRNLSDWDGIVKTWRQQGGDAMRGEYEKAYAAQHHAH